MANNWNSMLDHVTSLGQMYQWGTLLAQNRSQLALGAQQSNGAPNPLQAGVTQPGSTISADDAVKKLEN
eukprot:9876114-Karenia_brevis.AAC.1